MKKLRKLVLALSISLAIGTAEGRYGAASASEIEGKEESVADSIILEEVADATEEHGNEALDEGALPEDDEPKTEEDFAEEAPATESTEAGADEGVEDFVSQEMNLSETMPGDEKENAEEDILGVELEEEADDSGILFEEYENAETEDGLEETGTAGNESEKDGHIEIGETVKGSGSYDYYISVDELGKLGVTCYSESYDCEITLYEKGSEDEFFNQLVGRTFKSGNEYAQIFGGVAAGEYVLDVNCSGRYEFKVNFEASDEWVPCNHENTSMNKAYPVEVNKEYFDEGHLYYDIGDYENGYFVFRIPEDGYVNVVVESDPNVSISMYSSENLEKRLAYKRTGLAEGKYYLGIRYYRAENSYSFKIDFTSSDSWETEDNDDTKKADEIAIKKEYTGRLSYLSGGEDYSRFDCNDEDWYHFELDSPRYLSLKFKHDFADSGRWYLDMYKKNSMGSLVSVMEQAKVQARSHQEYNSKPFTLQEGDYWLKISEGPGSSIYYFSLNPEKYEQVLSVDPMATLMVGNTARLGVSGAVGALSYGSSNPLVAAVSNGVIRAAGVGTARVTITAAETDNYKASSAKFYVKVVPGSTAKVVAENLEAGVRVSWQRVNNAFGYALYRNNTKIATLNGANTLSYSDKKATKNGVKYTYKVTAFGSGGEMSPKSKSATVYRLAVPKISSVKNNAANKTVVTWAKNAKCGGYELVYSNSSKFKSGNKTLAITKPATVKKTISKLKKKKVYYFRIRAYKKLGTVKCYSQWSKVAKIKITK